MAGGTGVYITWVTGSIIASVLLMTLLKPPWGRITLAGFQDMFRRYWFHMFVVFSVYLWKDLVDQIDRALMANAQLDMTPFIYAIEGDLVLWVQQTFASSVLDFMLTHFYVAGYMFVVFSGFVYALYFDDRHMADRVSLSMFFTYILAIPFYLFFNVRVTGDHIPEMATIAYTLTPEIETWFIQIDPFTNGMPSLHIGLPFAIWYTYARHDDDGRWLKFRTFLAAYTAATAFTILYLGIHWIVDIIGGVLIGMLAVWLAERSQAWVWRWFDERVFVARFAWLLADWRRPAREAWALLRGWIDWFARAGSRQTLALIAACTLLTGTVLLWDATHQHFPAEGVTHPAEAGAADGQLYAIEETTPHNWTLTAWDLESGTTETVFENQTFDRSWGDFPITIHPLGETVYVSHGHEIRGYAKGADWTLDSERVTTVLYEQVSLGLDAAGERYLVAIADGELRVEDASDEAVNLSHGASGAPTFVGRTGDLLWWVEAENPSVVHLESLGTDLYRQVIVNASVSPEHDAQVEALTGTAVDMVNATIVDVAIDAGTMVVQVNLSAVDRLVMVDLETGAQQLLGDPVFPIAAPAIGHGVVVWQHQQFLDSLDPNPATIDWDVRYHDIAANRSWQLHGEDAVNQTAPLVMKEHIAWLQETEEGEVELRIFTLETTFEPYSSQTLQAFVILTPLLLALVAWQRAREVRDTILDEEE